MAETPDNCPTSANAATERHVNAKLEKEDLSTTKDLTQGTEDIDDRNVGCIQDPRTSSKAPAEGTSAKHAEMTPVVLESMLHKMQTEPQNSLPLTLRLPIDGKPNGRKQEAVDSVMTAEHMNGTVELAEPTEIVDVNRTALLGRKPVERACGVDEGDGMEHEPQMQLPKAEFYCKE